MCVPIANWREARLPQSRAVVNETGSDQWFVVLLSGQEDFTATVYLVKGSSPANVVLVLVNVCH